MPWSFILQSELRLFSLVFVGCWGCPMLCQFPFIVSCFFCLLVIMWLFSCIVFGIWVPLIWAAGYLYREGRHSSWVYTTRFHKGFSFSLMRRFFEVCCFRLLTRILICYQKTQFRIFGIGQVTQGRTKLHYLHTGKNEHKPQIWWKFKARTMNLTNY